MVPSNAQAATAHWSKWEHYCRTLQLDPTLQNIMDPIPYLQVFAYRFRHGRINTTQQPVCSRTVEGALRSIGQTFSSVGAPDPRFTTQGALDFHLKRMLSCYSKQDSPPAHVKPITVPILWHISAQAHLATDPVNQALADMICLAFFFLLRPGKYTGSSSDNQPFTLQDVEFYVGGVRLDKFTPPPDLLLLATFITLEFTTQKNSPRGGHWSWPQRQPPFLPCHRCCPPGPSLAHFCRPAFSAPSLLPSPCDQAPYPHHAP